MKGVMMDKENIFEPIDAQKRKLTRMVNKARKTNEMRDKKDRESGFASPGDTTLSAYLRCAISAIACGMSTKDWTATAEGYCMIQDIEQKARKSEAVAVQ